MQINGLGQISVTTVKTRKSGHGSGGNFVEVLEESDEAGARPAVSTASPLGQMTALLALQELPDATRGRSRGVCRAQDMLAGLEDLKQEILAGVISAPRFQALGALVRQNRENVDDPRLHGILDDIELRVEVELAKLEAGEARIKHQG